jgi:hypothetical protein
MGRDMLANKWTGLIEQERRRSRSGMRVEWCAIRGVVATTPVEVIALVDREP